MTAPLHWSTEDLLATDDVAEPLVAAGVRCHGGYAPDGTYVSPRTKHRWPAIRSWQAAHRADFGTEILDAPIEWWPEPYPNVAQTKLLLRAGVAQPTITTLTRIGTVEGFGSLIRHVAPGDLQRSFVESIDGTCTQHLQRGMFEAHARDEAGWEEEGGHREMWFAARDIAFDRPFTEDETQTMLERMGIAAPGGGPGRLASAPPVFADLEPVLESMLRRMIGLLFIEVSAFHMFDWAETVLSDTSLIAGDGSAAALVACIRRDEEPHVAYLETALTEMRDRTFVCESGRHLPGSEVIGRLWDLHLADSLGPRREEAIRLARAELDHALAGRRDRDDLVAEFDALGSAA
jgi:hypothetical protein